MKKQVVFSMISLAFLLIFGSCQKTAVSASNLYIPSDSDVTTTATLTDLTEGRALYINNCNRCHQLYAPDNYSASQWNSIISSMAPKTSLSSSEVSLVTKYLTRGK